jgi:CheY-like chemotaxis protein
MANVLVVDDVPDVADSFGELLALFGHRTRVAYSAERALDEIDSHLPDVVLLDINMPVVDGIQLAREIRRNWGQGIRLVAHTALPRGSVAAKLLEAGIDGFISKSAQPLELAFAIQGGPGTSANLRAEGSDRRRSRRLVSVARRSRDVDAGLAM